jgi:predicted permease
LGTLLASSSVVSSILRDVRYALRGLLKRPGFTAVVVITLALGLGVNTAIFSVVDATLIRSLPYRDPDRLAIVRETRPQENFSLMEASYPNYLDWSTRAHIGQLGGYGQNGKILATPNGSELIQTGVATSTFFDVLGVAPTLGRNFLAAEEQPGAAPAVLLTDAAWRTRFGADPKILGRTVTLSGTPTTVVGVLPRGFTFAPVGRVEAWVPVPASGPLRERRNLHWLNVVARLSPGVDVDAATREMSSIAGTLAHEYPDTNAGNDARVLPLRDVVLGNVRPIVLLLFAAVGLVLLIACANVANLLLARSATRRKEIAVRAALGASRARLVRQLVTESALLALAGGAVGVVLAMWGVDLLMSAIPDTVRAQMPYLADTRVDAGVLLASAGLALVTGVLVGLIPALRASRADVEAGLRDDSRTTTGRGRRFRDSLVAGEVAIAFILLAGAGLVSRSLARVLDTDPGFDPKGLLVFRVFMPPDKYDTDAVVAVAEERASARLAALPGVTGVAVSSGLPLAGGGNTIRFILDGEVRESGARDHEANIRDVSANYFAMMKIPLGSGRAFDARDREGAPNVVIVNRALARQMFPGSDAVGRKITFTFAKDQPPREIVGVVGDEKLAALDAPATPIVYLPFTQDASSAFSFALRSTGDPAALAGAARAAVNEIDPTVPIFALQTMDALVQGSPAMFLRRFPVLVGGAFAALALLLAVVGVYGVVSYSVNERTREIGIRRAIGAQAGDIRAMVVRQAMLPVAIGIAAGVPVALALSRVWQGMLYETSATDPATLVVAAVVLGLVASVAGLLPARRAARVDPMEAMR